MRLIDRALEAIRAALEADAAFVMNAQGEVIALVSADAEPVIDSGWVQRASATGFLTKLNTWPSCYLGVRFHSDHALPTSRVRQLLAPLGEDLRLAIQALHLPGESNRASGAPAFAGLARLPAEDEPSN